MHKRFTKLIGAEYDHTSYGTGSLLHFTVGQNVEFIPAPDTVQYPRINFYTINIPFYTRFYLFPVKKNSEGPYLQAGLRCNFIFSDNYIYRLHGTDIKANLYPYTYPVNAQLEFCIGFKGDFKFLDFISDSQLGLIYGINPMFRSSNQKIHAVIIPFRFIF